MSESMRSLAKSNLAKTPYSNVSFLAATLPSIPLDNNSVDVVISNCVLNLLPGNEKPKVWREIYRALDKEGRVCVSDILARKEMGEEMKNDAALLVGCISGAAMIEDTRRWLKQAGFKGINACARAARRHG